MVDSFLGCFPLQAGFWTAGIVSVILVVLGLVFGVVWATDQDQLKLGLALLGLVNVFPVSAFWSAVREGGPTNKSQFAAWFLTSELIGLTTYFILALSDGDSAAAWIGLSVGLAIIVYLWLVLTSFAKQEDAGYDINLRVDEVEDLYAEQDSLLPEDQII